MALRSVLVYFAPEITRTCYQPVLGASGALRIMAALPLLGPFKMKPSSAVLLVILLVLLAVVLVMGRNPGRLFHGGALFRLGETADVPHSHLVDIPSENGGHGLSSAAAHADAHRHRVSDYVVQRAVSKDGVIHTHPLQKV